MKLVVGVADMKLSSSSEDVIVTHALGSCLGITAYDSVTHVGGMLHVMMPLSNINPEKAQQNPYMFVDTGVPEFFKRIFAAGGARNRLTVKVAGALVMEPKLLVTITEYDKSQLVDTLVRVRVLEVAPVTEGLLPPLPTGTPLVSHW